MCKTCFCEERNDEIIAEIDKHLDDARRSEDETLETPLGKEMAKEKEEQTGEGDQNRQDGDNDKKMKKRT